MSRIPREKPERWFGIETYYARVHTPFLADGWLAVGAEEAGTGEQTVRGFDLDGTPRFRIVAPFTDVPGATGFPMTGFVDSPDGIWSLGVDDGHVRLVSIDRNGRLSRSVDLGMIPQGGRVLFGSGSSTLVPLEGGGVAASWVDDYFQEGHDWRTAIVQADGETPNVSAWKTLGAADRTALQVRRRSGVSSLVGASVEDGKERWSCETADLLAVNDDALLLGRSDGSQAVHVEERGALDGRVRWNLRVAAREVVGLLSAHVAVLFVKLNDLDVRVMRVKRDGSVLGESRLRLPIGADVPPRSQLVALDETHVVLRIGSTLVCELIADPTARAWTLDVGMKKKTFDATFRDSTISVLGASGISVWGPARA